MFNLRRLISREIPAINIFCFLIGILVIILLRKSFLPITEYVEIFSYQLKESQVSDFNIFFCILLNRISILIIVFICSFFYRGKYCIHILSAFFFFLYGIFVALNCLALGVKGLLPGVFLFVPQWLFYLVGFILCINLNASGRSGRKIYTVIRVIIPFVLILIGTIIESYVTQPLILKIF